MATIAENLQTIIDIKNDIKTAIIAKGVSVADSDGFATYADKIESIETGGGNTKINLQQTGLKLGYSKFREIPEWVDWNGITDMSNMFNGCSSLTSIPPIDTSNVTSMYYMFNGCSSLTSIPQLDTSKVTDMNHMFQGCSKLTTIPQLDTSKVTDMNHMFQGCSKLTSIPILDCSSVSNIGTFFGYATITTLSDLGGFKNLKINWNDTYGLYRLPNLTYESVINVINNLYDFRGNGDTTTTRTIKFNANSIALLSDEDIAVATNKGWIIS